jgi:hypothetical protein
MENSHVGNHTVETATGVAKAMLARGELTEVLCSLGHSFVEQLEDDAAGRLGVNGNVKLIEKRY